MHRLPDSRYIWPSESTLYFNKPCGTPEFDHAHEYAAIHAIDECFLEESRKPRCSHRSALCLLQLLPHPPNLACNTCDGSWFNGSRLDNCGTTGHFGCQR